MLTLIVIFRNLVIGGRTETHANLYDSYYTSSLTLLDLTRYLTVRYFWPKHHVPWLIDF